jgi:hypothetical protein
MAQDLSINIVAIDKTTAAFRSVSSGLGSISSSAGALTSKISAVTAALSALGGVAAARSVVNIADSLDQLSARSGIAVETLSSLANTAKFAGISQDDLAGALVRLNKAIAEAASGSKEQVAAFNNLGVSFRNADGSVRPVVEVLGDVANAFSGAETNAIKTQYAMALFGKSGADLIEFLDKGQIGIQEISSTIDEQFAKSAATFNDNLDMMGIRVQGFLGNRLGPLLEWVNGQFDKIAQADKNSKAWMGAAGGGRGFVNPDRVSPSQAKTSFKPLTTGPSDSEKAALKLLEDTRKEYEKISDEINKLIYGEDELLLIQFQRTNNDATAVQQYKELVAERRRLINLDKDQKEQSENQEKLDNLATEAAKKKAQKLKDLWEETRTPLEKYNEAVEDIYQSLIKGDVDLDTYYRKLDLLGKGISDFGEKGKESTDELIDAMRGWGNEFTGIMTDAVMTGKLQFKDLANSVIRDLIRMQIQSAITTPLVNMGKDLLGIQTAGARAMGGPVTTGQSYLVGENGPEIFTPSGSGSITANNQIASGGVTVNQVINVTTGVQQTVRAEIMTLMPQIAGAAKAAVADAKMRGGGYAAAMR